MMITPKMARKVLAPRNRSRSDKIVKMYIDQMKKGQFKLDPQDLLDIRQDGQHLFAESNKRQKP